MVLDRGIEVQDTNATNTNRVLTVEQLSVVHMVRQPNGRRKPFVAVNEASLHVDAGEIVGLVGESGSGKTTLSLAVCGLGKVSSGTLSSGGHDFSSLKGKARRGAHADVQMVFQDPHASLDARQRVGDGLDELRAIHPERTKRFTNEQLMERVGLGPEILQRLPNQISGGQAQRVSITRAMMLSPKLLVADEPTSGLDATVQAQILELFRHFQRTENLAVLFVSHNLAVVRQLCDRAYVMKEGVIVESGRTADLFNNPQHEYTRRLVAAVPGKDAKLAKELS
jgi:ABC-type glutathione transport system ATPase component